MLHRRIGLLQAVSLNMAMMVGIGPFITIPDLVRALHGPWALLGWVLGAAVAAADGLVWCELAAAFPGSGGTYHFYDAVYGESRVGRLLKFLFVWQFLFSGPLELASGAIGLGMYAGFLWPSLTGAAWSVHLVGPMAWTVSRSQLLAVAVMVGIVALAYRRIEVAGRWMVVLWAGMLATLVWMIVAGLSRFNPALAFAATPMAVDAHFVRGLGTALGMAMYCYLGYYQVCYLGDEVADPSRTLPRSILISVALIALMYLALNLGILGTIPWPEVATSKHIATDFMARRYGPTAALAIAAMILWTGATGTFSGVLSYGRIPYAAAKAGHFFHALAKTHPTGEFPHRSLILVGGLSALACLFDLATVIAALLASRIVIQFLGQAATLAYVRSRPDLKSRLSFRMALYPLPALVASAGWLFIFATLDPNIIGYGLLSLALGVAAFVAWDRRAGSGGSEDRREA
jgi:amino acid transporter